MNLTIIVSIFIKQSQEIMAEAIGLVIYPIKSLIESPEVAQVINKICKRSYGLHKCFFTLYIP